MNTMCVGLRKTKEKENGQGTAEQEGLHHARIRVGLVSKLYA